MLRPAGRGLFTVSTGRTSQGALVRALYGAADDEEVEVLWRTSLAGVAAAKVVILGVPSDCGAGLMRGASYGPAALRRAMLKLEPNVRAMLAREGVVDLGDVFTVPQLLTDDMLSDAQKEATRAALYPSLTASAAAALPVAPLSITERVLRLVLDANPRCKPLVIGGDHSVAWPVVAALAHAHDPAVEPWAIVQPDAHTDLLPHRLGVRICFATWAYHANELLGRGGRLVQVGVRSSGSPKGRWESELGVKQFWADELHGLGDDGALDVIVTHLHRLGVRKVYLSNDIDATDAAEVPATGAPETGGLSSAFVRRLIDTLGTQFRLIGADLMEVAPLVGDPAAAERTCRIGASYLLGSLQGLLQSP